MLDVRYINLAQRTGRRRLIEVQTRAQRLDAERIDALGPAEGAVVLPHANLTPGAHGLTATWYQTARDVHLHGARRNAEWLILLEDDALLVPGFGRRARATLRNAPDDCFFVQLGFLSKYTWFGPRKLWLNIVMAILFVLRGEWRASVRNRNGGDDPNFSTDLFPGAQASAVRVATIPQLLDLLDPYESVTDELFRARSFVHPGRFLRARRQHAIQWPFIGSDLSSERNKVLDELTHLVDTEVVDRCAWVTTLRTVAADRASDSPPWLALVDPSAVPMPQFKLRALEVLDSVPNECNLVQLATLTDYTWRDTRPVRENLASVGRFVSRRAWEAEPREPGDDHRLYSTKLRPDAVAIAVRSCAIDDVLAVLGPGDTPIDAVFTDLPDTKLGPVVRARRQLATVVPGVVSRLRRRPTRPV